MGPTFLRKNSEAWDLHVAAISYRKDVTPVVTTLRISADVGPNASAAATNMAKSMGYSQALVLSTTQVGPREFDVQLIVTK